VTEKNRRRRRRRRRIAFTRPGADLVAPGKKDKTGIKILEFNSHF
jgi:hypothetical protein